MQHQTKLAPLALTAALLGCSPATAGEFFQVDDIEADQARVFILLAEVATERESYMIDIEFDDHPTGAENELACRKQEPIFVRRFGRMGWGVASDCFPKATGARQ